MDAKLQELVTRLETISDVRNRDRSNFVTFSFENPSVETPKGSQPVLYALIASQLEPLAEIGAPLPINLIWICYDPTSSDYKKVFKRRDIVPSNGYASTWIELSKYDEIFEEPQYFAFDPSLIGSQGPKGDKGDPGPQGVQGERGIPGEVGAQGLTGPQGIKGDTGSDGYQAWLDIGNAGTKADYINAIKGPKGDVGPQGPQGIQGIQGPKGDKGDKGDVGPVSTVPGPQGPKGDVGPAGPIGPQGIQGPQGNTGSQGPQGLTGPQGVKGDKGIDAGGWIVIGDGDAADVSKFKNAPVYGFDAYNASDMPVNLQGTKNYYTGMAVGLPNGGNTVLRGFQIVHNWNSETGGPMGSFVRTKDDTQPNYGAWRRLAYSDETPYDLAACHIGKLTNGAMICRYVAVRAFKFTAGMTTSKATVDTPATAQVIMSIRKNGNQFATVTFAAGATVGTFTCAADIAFAAGDVLTIYGPASADSTFATSSYTLAAIL